ncbi:MAG: hypothetical protein QOI66_4074 [Myxococcales bacterium]|nr:hypothetical protein [Myxococcales bacterium]
MSHRGGIGLAVVMAAGLGGLQRAQARSSNVVSYAAADVWPTAIRFLRVDRDYNVKEKDEVAGYIIFDVVENKRTYRGSLELVKTTDGDGRAATQMVVTLAELPRHFEVALLDKLSTKLRDERGPPGPPPPKQPPPSAPGTPDHGPPRQPPPTPEPGGLPKPPVWGPEVR